MKYTIFSCFLLILTGCGESVDRPPTNLVEPLVQRVIVSNQATETVDLIGVTHIASEKSSEEPNALITSRFEYTLKARTDLFAQNGEIARASLNMPSITIVRLVHQKGDELKREMLTTAQFKLGSWDINYETSLDIEGLQSLANYDQENRKYIRHDDPALGELKETYKKVRMERRR
jgi:hypothetical protein